LNLDQRKREENAYTVLGSGVLGYGGLVIGAAGSF
jgi:hypothetical protein